MCATNRKVNIVEPEFGKAGIVKAGIVKAGIVKAGIVKVGIGKAEIGKLGRPTASCRT